jgi:hypothetical protein
MEHIGKFVFVISVLVAFRDKENPSRLLKPGDSLETEDLRRVNDIVSRGLGVIGEFKAVEVESEDSASQSEEESAPGEEEEKQKQKQVVSVLDSEFELAKVKEGLGVIGVKVAANAGAGAVAKKVASLSEEQAKELFAKLSE